MSAKTSRSAHELALLRIYGLLANDFDHDSSPKARAKVAASVAGEALGENKIASDDDEDFPALVVLYEEDEAKADALQENEDLKETREDRLLGALTDAISKYRRGDE